MTGENAMGEILWEPSLEAIESARITQFMRWLEGRYGSFSSYETLWNWSVTDIEAFWGAAYEYFLGAHPGPVLNDRTMPGAGWFPDARVNFAQEVFRRTRRDAPVLYFENERGDTREWRYPELQSRVASLAAALKAWGVQPGDRVAAYLPNIPEAVVSLLAAASVGAVWSICSPDFGAPSVLDRFRQIAPKVLLVADGYWYNGRAFDRRSVANLLAHSLPSVERVVTVPYLGDGQGFAVDHPAVARWESIMAQAADLVFESVPFQHPLWILYSSGTTGLPKPIVHGHGNMVLTHLVTNVLHLNLGPDDQFFWFSTTGWMMWNVVVSGLLAGAGIVLYDGSPSYPSLDHLWTMAERLGVTVFGCSAAYVHSLMKADLRPGTAHDLSGLKTLATTGSPLNLQAYDWVYEAVKADVQLAPASGGTDICSSFVGGCPILPVRRGEMQCRALGAKVEAYDESGRAVVDKVGELVVTEPMPAMPLYFWGDEAQSRYRQSYFERHAGVWTHGDWIRITPSGGVVISGRSDSTLNRYGVRMGSAEVYRVVDTVAEIEDSLVVEFERVPGQSFMPLFVKLRAGAEWSPELEERIRAAIKTTLSPRHVPDALVVVSDIPKTLSNKKLEVPIKRVLQGEPLDQVLNPDAMMNPESLADFVHYAKALAED